MLKIHDMVKRHHTNVAKIETIVGGLSLKQIEAFWKDITAYGFTLSESGVIIGFALYYMEKDRIIVHRIWAPSQDGFKELGEALKKKLVPGRSHTGPWRVGVILDPVRPEYEKVVEGLTRADYEFSGPPAEGYDIEETSALYSTETLEESPEPERRTHEVHIDGASRREARMIYNVSIPLDTVYTGLGE